MTMNDKEDNNGDDGDDGEDDKEDGLMLTMDNKVKEDDNRSEGH